MAFPTSPTNGQQSVVNGITYQYASATNSWTRISGTANTISASGNITAGNLNSLGVVSALGNVVATGNVLAANLVATANLRTTGNLYVGTANAGYVYGNAAFMTGISAGTSVSKIENGATNINIPDYSGNVTMDVAGQANTVVVNLGSLTMYGTFAGPRTLQANVTVASAVNALLLGPVTVDDGYNITVPNDSSLSTYTDGSPDLVGSSLSVTGNITGGNILTAGNITVNTIFTNRDILPTSNATANIGSSSFQYNTVFARATEAQYADLAENYEADATYEPGTVLCFGGSKEVTICNLEDCTRVAGVVSTNPSYLMNSGQTGTHVASLALQGRVPTSVTGTVHKGDLMVSAGNGRAKTNNNARAGTIIGKALANSEGDAVIEVVVGRD